MTFLDKLEILLLEHSLEIFCNIKGYTDGVYAFEILLKDKDIKDEDIPSYKLVREKEYKENGIKEMIAYLKDPIGLTNRKYTHYALNFLGYPNGKEFFNKILELEPTDDELIHLYQHAAFHFHFKLLFFARAVKSRESLIKIIKLGYDGKYADTYHEMFLQLCVDYLYEKYDDISEEEYIDVLFNYVKNSKSMKEKKDDIVNWIILTVEEINKAEKLILDLFNETISIKEEPIEKKVIKLVIDDFCMIRNYRFVNHAVICTFFNQFQIEIKRNMELLSDMLDFIYYRQYNPKTNRQDHVLLIENISQDNTEINILLDKYTECFFEEYKNLKCVNKTANFLKENPAIFRKFIMDAFMPPSAAKEDKKPIKV